MSELVDLASIADRRDFRQANDSAISMGGVAYSGSTLRNALAAIKATIADLIRERPAEIEHHRRFVRALHGRLEAGKSEASRVVDYFTLNYDTLIEDALALEKVPLADGFNGGPTGWWDVASYDDSSVRARVYKVHGSIDWCLLDDDLMPRRVRRGLEDSGQLDPVLIWPAATKYREAQRDPYAQIIDRMRRAFRPKADSELVLAAIGYSFRDSHINYELDRALREARGRLTVLVFTGAIESGSQLDRWLDEPLVRDHVHVYSGGGHLHAGHLVDSSRDLPWWRFEILARLLGGDR